ncbi:LysR family transcriptional regulator [Bacillus horti]|uniref:DNA-binding transcriptional LysR family regulator n=1 Tax=Caldalkalibacillus horti TaxID=77523 RepID=A0ABT9W1A8_9BACI|nr:LysR family transcriptional regulator [Bacillus horti]MDQ0167028.1 DNA-binding transcriptional LysR family regulator [Bacillus horti]
MTIIQMQVFVKVVETGSFTKAAEELGLTQSAVSHAIAGLESTLGFHLIIRNRSGTRMTANGEKMLTYIRHILHQTDLMQQEADNIMGLQGGKVRIGTFESVSIHWLPGIIGQFQKNHPQIDIELLEGEYQEIKEWIADGTVDLGFILEEEKLSLDFHPLKKDRLVLLLPDGHFLSEVQDPSIEQIGVQPFIMPKKGCDEHLRKLFKEANVQANTLFTIRDAHTIVALVQAGLGISIMPELTLPKQMDKIRTAYVGEEVYRTIGVASSSFKRLSPAVKSFFELTKSFVQKQAC